MQAGRYKDPVIDNRYHYVRNGRQRTFNPDTKRIPRYQSVVYVRIYTRGYSPQRCIGRWGKFHPKTHNAKRPADKSPRGPGQSLVESYSSPHTNYGGGIGGFHSAPIFFLPLLRPFFPSETGHHFFLKIMRFYKH